MLMHLISDGYQKHLTPPDSESGINKARSIRPADGVDRQAEKCSLMRRVRMAALVHAKRQQVCKCCDSEVQQGISEHTVQ